MCFCFYVHKNRKSQTNPSTYKISTLPLCRILHLYTHSQHTNKIPECATRCADFVASICERNVCCLLCSRFGFPFWVVSWSVLFFGSSAGDGGWDKTGAGDFDLIFGRIATWWGPNKRRVFLFLCMYCNAGGGEAFFVCLRILRNDSC